MCESNFWDGEKRCFLGNDQIRGQGTCSCITGREGNAGMILPTFQAEKKRIVGRVALSGLQNCLCSTQKVELSHVVIFPVWSTQENISLVTFILKNPCFVVIILLFSRSL